MLVVGGIKHGFDSRQPLDASGCDTSANFRQGLGLFSLNSHTWTTRYDPTIGTASYSINPSISKVIGGNASGGATLQTPVAGFSQKSLGTLLGARPEPNSSALSNSTASPISTILPNSTDPPNSSALPSVAPASPSAVPTHHPLATTAIVGIVIGTLAGVGMILGALAFLCITRRRKQHKSWPPSISTPIVTQVPHQMRYSSELDDICLPIGSRGRLHDNLYVKQGAAHELVGEGKLQRLLVSTALSAMKQVDIHEMEARSPISPHELQS